MRKDSPEVSSLFKQMKAVHVKRWGILAQWRHSELPQLQPKTVVCLEVAQGNECAQIARRDGLLFSRLKWTSGPMNTRFLLYITEHLVTLHGNESVLFVV